MIGRLLPIAILALLLSGCGQKGPLYLPAEPETAPAAVGTDTPADNRQDENAPFEPTDAE